MRVLWSAILILVAVPFCGAVADTGLTLGVHMVFAPSKTVFRVYSELDSNDECKSIQSERLHDAGNVSLRMDIVRSLVRVSNIDARCNDSSFVLPIGAGRIRVDRASEPQSIEYLGRESRYRVAISPESCVVLKNGLCVCADGAGVTTLGVLFADFGGVVLVGTPSMTEAV